MKTTMIALIFTTMTGCGMVRGLTLESTKAECEDVLKKSVEQFCDVASTNRDKIKNAEEILSQ